MLKHLNISIAGAVQGVGFRWEAKKRAEALGLFGFVTNRPQGTVYIEIEGAEENLQKFLKWCEKGPFFAKVQSADAKEGEVKNYRSFEIV